MKAKLIMVGWAICCFGCQTLDYIEQPIITLVTVNGISDNTDEYHVAEGGAVEVLASLTAVNGIKEIRVLNLGFDDYQNRIDLDITDQIAIEIDRNKQPAEATLQFTADYGQFNDGIVSGFGKYHFDVYVVDDLGAVAYSTFLLIP